MNQKALSIIVIAVVMVSAIGYFAFVKKSEPVAQNPTPTQTTNTTKTPTPTPKDETANWKTYNWNTKLNVGVNFRYPSNWKVEKYSSGSSESIIVYPSDQNVNLQPVDYTAELDNLKHSIILHISTGSCLNTQCLTKIDTADDWISELGATKLSGKLNISSFEGYYVKVPGDNTYRYILSKNGVIVEMNTVAYVSYMTQIFNNLSISTASTPTSTTSETSSQEVFKNQPGAIRSLAVSGNNQWIFSVDLLSYNPHWLPGVDSTGGFFINQDPKIRNLTVTKNTEAYNCGGPDGDGGKPGLLVDTSSFISQIQADINSGNYTVKKGQYGGPVRYLDINGSNITAMYQQCLP